MTVATNSFRRRAGRFLLTALVAAGSLNVVGAHTATAGTFVKNLSAKCSPATTVADFSLDGNQFRGHTYLKCSVAWRLSISVYRDGQLVPSLSKDAGPFAANKASNQLTKPFYVSGTGRWQVVGTVTATSGASLGAFSSGSPIDLRVEPALRSPSKYRITNDWGCARHYGGHTGTDFGNPAGSSVFAAGAGTVTVAGNTGAGYGNRVEVRHPNGKVTTYSHLSSIKVNTGVKVTQGQSIGTAGSTGGNYAPHLHFEVLVNGTRVNPKAHVPELAKWAGAGSC